MPKPMIQLIAWGMSKGAANNAAAIRDDDTEEEAQTFAKAYDTAITLGMSKDAANQVCSW